MIKARATVRGEDIVVIGLSEQNLTRLELGEPIAFSGREVKVDGVHVLIAFAPLGRKSVNVPAVYEALGLSAETQLVVLALPPSALADLRRTGLIINSQVGGLPGETWIVYGETEKALSDKFNEVVGAELLIETPKPGERFDLDVITGKMVRSVGDA